MGNSMQGGKVYISAAQSTEPANAAAYAALSWTPINNVGNMAAIGDAVNALIYPTWGDKVAQKAKGMTNAGDPTLEVMRNTQDTGQNAARTAAKTNLTYAFKIERNDKLTGGGTNSIFYNWGLIAGPTRPQGGNEDFDVEIFTLMFQGTEVTVNPT